MTRCLCLLALLLALLPLPRTAQAAQSFDNCSSFIAALPANVPAPGRVCLSADLTTANSSGVAINIAASDVVLDCNGYRIDGSGAGTATAMYGIYSLNRSHVTVRNCDVRGFYFGIVLSGGAGHLVEDNRLDGNTFVGTRVDGDYSIVRRNKVTNTGGSTANISAFGIVTNGSVSVLDNQIDGVVARAANNGSAYGVFGNTNDSGSIDRNSIVRLLFDGTGRAFGINYQTSNRINVRDNQLVGEGGLGLGVRCQTANGSVRDNTIIGYSAGFSGCSNDGGNVNVP
jgi:nitrous oxidase accessory protein NosD